MGGVCPKEAKHQSRRERLLRGEGPHSKAPPWEGSLRIRLRADFMPDPSQQQPGVRSREERREADSRQADLISPDTAVEERLRPPPPTPPARLGRPHKRKPQQEIDPDVYLARRARHRNGRGLLQLEVSTCEVCQTLWHNNDCSRPPDDTCCGEELSWSITDRPIEDRQECLPLPHPVNGVMTELGQSKTEDAAAEDESCDSHRRFPPPYKRHTYERRR